MASAGTTIGNKLVFLRTTPRRARTGLGLDFFSGCFLIVVVFFLEAALTITFFGFSGVLRAIDFKMTEREMMAWLSAKLAVYLT